MTSNVCARLTRALLSASVIVPPLLAGTAYAGEGTLLPPITIETAPPALDTPLTATTIAKEGLARLRARTSDAASLFEGVPGVSVYRAGGVSGLPSIHGLGNARVSLQVNGMTVGVACPNDMNAPLSYIDPTNVAVATVIAGLTPVSMGGDSIAGTIVVKSPDPVFALDGEAITSGRLSAFYRSNGDGIGGSVTAAAANADVSIRYTGAAVASDNFDGGGDDGVVRSTEYESANHQLTLGLRDGANLFVIEASQQYIPREGYPNQYMDMLENRSTHLNGRYDGAFSWGTLEARVYWQDVRHYMNFLDDKGGIATGGMPMYTDGETFGYAVKAAIMLSAEDTLRIGNEYVRQTLDDWWPPVAGSMMMGPNTFININGGERERFGVYAEWERAWSGEWSTLIGARNDTVWMDTGDVQPYSWMGMMSMADAMAAADFNARGHDRRDNNIDITALVRFAPSDTATYELGVARKSRAPTLYERYAWGRGSMSSRMIGWFGDGNGYVGNLDLESETATTISASASWRGGGAHPWEIKITPYYTDVEDYIGVTKLQDLMSFAQLQFVNHDAELYGVDLSASWRLMDAPEDGSLDLTLAAGWVEGRDTTAGTDLYHLMPVEAQIALEYRKDGWSGTAALRLAGEKSNVDTLRGEPRTGAFALLDLRGGYAWEGGRVDVGVENVFDTEYDDPLGGVSLGDYNATGVLRPVPGMGRSFGIALTFDL